MSRRSSVTSQNINNFISEKPSIRNHQPAGGTSTVASLIYGGGGAAVESPFVGRQRQGSIVKRPQEEPQLPQEFQQKHMQMKAGYQQPVQSTSSNQFAHGSSQNTGNTITDRRTTRVHAPPGGVSSIQFG